MLIQALVAYYSCWNSILLCKFREFLFLFSAWTTNYQKDWCLTQIAMLKICMNNDNLIYAIFPKLFATHPVLPATKHVLTLKHPVLPVIYFIHRVTNSMITATHPVLLNLPETKHVPCNTSVLTIIRSILPVTHSLSPATHCDILFSLQDTFCVR